MKKIVLILLMSVLMLTGCAVQDTIPMQQETAVTATPSVIPEEKVEGSVPQSESTPRPADAPEEPETVAVEHNAVPVNTKSEPATVPQESMPAVPAPVEAEPESASGPAPEEVTKPAEAKVEASPSEPTVPAMTNNVSTEEPVIVEHAKTGYDEPDTVPPEHAPEPEPTIPVDFAMAVTAAENYAVETYHLTIDPLLGFDNSSYRFPAVVPQSVPQETLNTKAIDMVEFTFQQMMRRNGVTIEQIRESGIRCRIYIESNGPDIYTYVFYA